MVLTELETLLLLALAVVVFFWWRAEQRAVLVAPMVQIIRGVAHKQLRVSINPENGALVVTSTK